jgi:ABC-type nickel/cobalt efflux system permease component RcnA
VRVSFVLLAILSAALLLRSYRRSRARAATRPAPPPLTGRTRLAIAVAVVVFVAGLTLPNTGIGTPDNVERHAVDIVAPLIGYAALWLAWRAYRAERSSARTRRGRRR